MQQFYSLEPILEVDAHYNIIFGERNSGKSFQALKYCIQHYFETGEQFAIIRRWQDDIKKSNAIHFFDNLIQHGIIKELSGGEYDSIIYSSREFRFYNTETENTDKHPCCFAFSLSGWEHVKSSSYPNVTRIVFDEFLTRTFYLPNEFIIFMNLLSTIIRERTNVKIFMLGNSINKYPPYFNEMGLSRIKQMKPGIIDVYTYGKTKLKVAVELCEPVQAKKESNFYFAFENPQLDMITGDGQIWEMALYPHLNIKYRPCDIVYTYFIVYEGDTLQCEIVSIEDNNFTFIHRKTTPLKENPYDLIFTPYAVAKSNYVANIYHSSLPFTKKVLRFFMENKVFYQDNEVGEIVRGYFMKCRQGDDDII